MLLIPGGLDTNSGETGCRVDSAVAVASHLNSCHGGDFAVRPVPSGGDVQDYVASEALVRSAGPKWTILRFGAGLADALARDVIWARRDGELVAPAAQATSVPAAARDLAEATARVATGARHENKLYELTGPRAIDWSDLASLASEADATRRPYRAVTDAEYRDYLAGLGLPENYVDGLFALYSAFRSGWNSRPDPTLARLLGRDPVDPIDAVRERLEPMARMLARR